MINWHHKSFCVCRSRWPEAYFSLRSHRHRRRRLAQRSHLWRPHQLQVQAASWSRQPWAVIAAIRPFCKLRVHETSTSCLCKRRILVSNLFGNFCWRCQCEEKPGGSSHLLYINELRWQNANVATMYEVGGHHSCPWQRLTLHQRRGSNAQYGNNTS